MKIYKLDIDTSKPIRKVVQMQQNSTGALSVDVSNDGWPIRNLSCALYDGETELSAYAELSTGAGYKIDVGADTKVVKFTAKSVLTECSASYIASVGTSGPMQTTALKQIQIDTGIYRQDEFNNVAFELGNISAGVMTMLYVSSSDLSNANFEQIRLAPWNKNKPIWFISNNTVLPEDALIVITAPTQVYKNGYIRRNGTTATFTYPAIGYYTDYSLDTVIRPSENAHCYAEQEVSDPTPDPEPEPTPDPEEPVEP